MSIRNRNLPPVSGVLALLLFTTAARAQEAISAAFQNPFAHGARLDDASGGIASATPAVSETQSSGPLRIDLSGAEGRAVAASKAKELASLNRTAARYHLQAVQADYFPKINSSYFNLHFNKFLGKEIEFQLFNRTAALPLLSQNESIFAVTVTQPVTPLLQVHEAVKVARADERIAQAKLNAVVTHVSAAVENTYFNLLIAQREQMVAEIKVTMLQSSTELVSLAGSGSTKEADAIEAMKSLETAKAQVADSTRALNTLMGLPPDTLLELETPPPVVETISTGGTPPAQAIDKSPEVIEAQQTLEKAKAAERVAKLEYVPAVAGLWGYSYQTAIPALPRDFSFVGFVATWNVFDFGKRERTISERTTQVKMAETNLALVRAKVTETIQKAFLDVQRTRRIMELTRRVASMYEHRPALYRTVSLADKAEKAQAELEMFQAELDFRLAYGEMKRTLGVE